MLDRKLSFEEVKQQIDNGQPIQMDLYEQGNEAPKGSENNLAMP
ncbi:hypothetical protein [Lactococcus fujiensis]|nr:hypothetical protein [Lactococcus fujiensis]